MFVKVFNVLYCIKSLDKQMPKRIFSVISFVNDPNIFQGVNDLIHLTRCGKALRSADLALMVLRSSNKKAHFEIVISLVCLCSNCCCCFCCIMLSMLRLGYAYVSTIQSKYGLNSDSRMF